jgi:hypothetical protein
MQTFLIASSFLPKKIRKETEKEEDKLKNI